MSEVTFESALERLNREVGAYQVSVQVDPMDARRCIYTVPVGNRKQVVSAGPADDAMFGGRLDFSSLAATKVPDDADVLLRVLWIARGLRRARIAVAERGNKVVVVLASFIPDELGEPFLSRHMAALFEVAAVADSLESQLSDGKDKL